jgi:hypothetical protein
LTVNYFDKDVVSIESADEIAISEIIAMQDKKINCVVISKDEFKELVTDSLQLNRIREVVKNKIASKYSPADEIAMMKKNTTESKRVAYEAFVTECIAYGDALKAQVGY